jgi:hypothetical protein
MIALASKRRLRAPLHEPVGPLIECELLAGEKSREVAVVSGVETIPKKPFGLIRSRHSPGRR